MLRVLISRSESEDSDVFLTLLPPPDVGLSDDFVAFDIQNVDSSGRVSNFGTLVRFRIRRREKPFGEIERVFSFERYFDADGFLVTENLFDDVCELIQEFYGSDNIAVIKVNDTLATKHIKGREASKKNN